jgi:hypothetical protein
MGSAMWENFKIGLLLFCIVIAFFLLAPHIPIFVGSVTNNPRIMVEYRIAVQGRVTGSRVNRQHHLYYLNGDTKRDYDFNAFTQPLTPAQQQMDEEAQHTLGLGQQLETGDSISKAANSTVLTVQRGDSISRWFCSTQAIVN